MNVGPCSSEDCSECGGNKSAKIIKRYNRQPDLEIKKRISCEKAQLSEHKANESPVKNVKRELCRRSGREEDTNPLKMLFLFSRHALGYQRLSLPRQPRMVTHFNNLTTTMISLRPLLTRLALVINPTFPGNNNGNNHGAVIGLLRAPPDT